MNGDDQRRWTGSWLGGARSAGVDLGYPGERFKLPRTGSGAVAGYGRRLGALFVDWVLSMLVAAVLAAELGWGLQQRNLATLAVFGVETWLLTGFMGFTVGKRIFGLRVARLDAAPIGAIWALVRTALLLAVIPALLWDRDCRGLHDRAANTIVLRA
jgi:uncharacterized RDD family membrane protein YckC